jgi:hypothetical protein
MVVNLTVLRRIGVYQEMMAKAQDLGPSPQGLER